MDDFLNSDMAISVASFLLGVLLTGLAWGAEKLISSFKKSSNKLDDVLIPLLEVIKDAIAALKDSTPVEKKPE